MKLQFGRIRQITVLLLCMVLIICSFSACSCTQKQDSSSKTQSTQEKSKAEKDQNSDDKAASTENSKATETQSGSTAGDNAAGSDQQNISGQPNAAQGTEDTNPAGGNGDSSISGQGGTGSGDSSGNAPETGEQGDIVLPEVDIPVVTDDSGMGDPGFNPESQGEGSEYQAGIEDTGMENDTPISGGDSDYSAGSDIYVDEDGAIELPEIPIGD